MSVPVFFSRGMPVYCQMASSNVIFLIRMVNSRDVNCTDNDDAAFFFFLFLLFFDLNRPTKRPWVPPAFPKRRIFIFSFLRCLLEIFCWWTLSCFSENEFLRNDIRPRSETVFMIWMCSVPVLVSHFLVHHFNAQMYNEFRSLALDDISYTMRQWRVSDGLLRVYSGSFQSSSQSDSRKKSLFANVGHNFRSTWTSYFNKIANQTKTIKKKKTNCYLDTGLKTELEKLFYFSFFIILHFYFSLFHLDGYFLCFLVSLHFFFYFFFFSSPDYFI